MIRALLVVGVVAACSKQPSGVVARLEEKQAQVERQSATTAPWQPAKVGDVFVIGSAVRTGDSSHARLRLGKAGRLDVKPNAVVYFTRTPGHTRDDLRVETGSVELEAGDDEVGLGDAVLDPHGRATVEHGADGVTINVSFGRVVLEDNVIPAGKSITITDRNARTAQADAGVVAHAGFTVEITGKAARAGEGELAIGMHTDVIPGTGLIIPDGSIAAITGNGARGETSGPSKLSVGEGVSLVKLSAGTLAIEAKESDAVATLPGGTVTTKAGGAATAVVDPTGAATIDAQRGDTIVETAKGKEALAAGESITISAKGEIERAAPPPKRTVATIAAGESPIIHDAVAPTPIRVSFGAACTGGGTVEVAKDRSFKRVIARSGGTEAVNVLVPGGSVFYRLRCGAKTTSGTIRIAKDSGKTPLPKVAAKTFVELDGRDYTVLYQNLLPELTLSWKTAPKKAGYTFVLEPPAGAPKRFTSATSTVTIKSGELREGTYKAWAEPQGGGRKSEEGKLSIEFDNATPSASIDDVASDAGKLHVKGTVIEGSTVSVDGAAVELDRHRRFQADVAPGETEDGVAVRIANTKGGIHYYVVRTAPR